MVWKNFQVKARTNEFNEDIENINAAELQKKAGTIPLAAMPKWVRPSMVPIFKGITVIVSRKTKINDKGEFDRG
jgi:hypothetical protein